MRLAPVAIAALVLAGTALGQEAPPGKVIVDLAAAEDSDAWVAAALEAQLAAELSRFRRVELLPKADTGACPDRAPRCLVEAHSAGAEIVVIGSLAGNTLAFEVHETWTHAMATSGTIALEAGLSPGGLRHRLGEIVRPIVQSGGLLDQRPAATPSVPADAGVARAPLPAGADGGAATAIAPETAPSPIALGVLLLAVLAVPLLVGLLLTGRQLLRLRSARWALLLLALGVAANVALPELTALLGPARAALGHPAAGLALNLAGGMLWAALGLLLLSFAFPALPGIGRIRPDRLWRVLRAWAATAVMRASLLVVFLPLLLGVLQAGRSLAISGRVLWSLVIPAAGLLAVLWLLLLVDVLAAFLDRRLVQGAPSRLNPWHVTVRRYARGYVRRTGPDVSTELLSRTLFLPARGLTIASYGGGFGPARVLIGQRLLDVALGLPEEPEKDQRQVNTEELPAGILVPNTGATTSGGRGRTRRGRDRRREAERKGQWPIRPRGFAPRMIGEAATLLGWVLPAQRASTVPLISDTREDYEVVHSLLTEHYAAFEKDAWDDDDDSDPRHKDFLYGALLRELGAAGRRDTLLSTLRLTWIELFSGVTPLRLLGQLLGRAYQRVLSRAPAVVADAYVALNYGLHPLVQLYDWLRTEDDGPLTARADAPRLYRASRDALDRVLQSPPEALDQQNLRATLRSRLVELSGFFHVSIEEAHTRSFRHAAAAIAVLLGAALLGLSVNTSLDYHPVYVERMRALSEAADAGPDSGGTDGGTW